MQYYFCSYHLGLVTLETDHLHRLCLIDMDQKCEHTGSNHTEYHPIVTS